MRLRPSNLLETRGVPAKLSCAVGILDHLRDWYFGTKEARFLPTSSRSLDIGTKHACVNWQGEFVSMVVESDGSYGVPQGMMFSMPVTCREGEFTVVQGLTISAEMQALIEQQVAELKLEKQRADAALVV